ncbi:unnamed protein product, partial [Larinioides sclopetarius]
IVSGGVVNDGFVSDGDQEVDTCFVDDRSQDRINCGYPKVDSVVSSEEQNSSSRLCIARRIHRPGITPLHPRRLWFERRHWGSILPREARDRLPRSVQFPHREVGQAHLDSEGGTSSAPPSKVVYNIGVFYSDTDLCEKSSADQTETGDHASGDDADKQIVVCSNMTSNSGVVGEGGLNLPHDQHPRRSSNSCRSTRRLTTHTQLTPDTFSPPPDSPTPENNTLPDILNSHMPPPYSTLPPTSGGRRLPPPSHPPPPPPPTTACPHLTNNHPRRTSRGGAGRSGAFRGFNSRGDRGRRGVVPGFAANPPAASESDEPKHCCGVMVTQTVSIRWFIVMIAFVGLCCAIVGTVLGALKATGREHLTVSLLMIGVGIVLITVSGIAWRLTSHDAPSCRAMLGLQNSEQEPNRRFVPRVPPYGRPHHPYAAMMYPEFQYRPPPPSYQASMQEYRLRLLLLDRQQGTGSASNTASALSPVSPPPTYRSHNTGTLHSRPPLTLTDREYSRPPSYRSRASSAGVLRPSTETLCSLSTQQQSPQQPQPQLQPVPATSHSRNPSLSLSFLSHESLFLDSGHSRPAAAQDPVHFTSPSGDSVVGGLSDDSRDGGSSTWDRGGGPWKPLPHDVNAVTIVQTTDSSQVLNRDTASVILSVPGREVPQMSGGSAGEVRILAHV